MRFESVTAHAFGPFEDQTKEFGPGMNVVHGPNESGKSSWQAALYAGLCGVRRARGQPRRKDREFAERHRPWDGDRWEVSAVVALEDGRRVELRHDLDGRVDCTASDADLAGRDYSSEIITEGSPDGSRWLGLDRDSFLSTACVFQRDLLGVIERESNSSRRPRVDALQDQLQRAAATAGGDETAARALDVLTEFRSEHVGADRANARRPLRLSRQWVKSAQRDLDRAREAHREYLDRQQRVEELEEAFRQRQSRATLMEAAIAIAAADRVEHRLERARALEVAFPSGAPAPVTTDDELARQVATALHAWRTRPDATEPTGATIQELQIELEELDLPAAPAVPSGTEATRGGARGQTVTLALALVAAAAGAGLLAAGLAVPGLVLLAGGAATIAWALLRSRSARRTPSSGGELVAERASRRGTVEALLEARRREESTHADSVERRADVEELVRGSAASAGVAGDTPAASVRGLRRWEAGRDGTMAENERARGAWNELQRLLDNRSLEDLADAATQRRTYAARLAAACDVPQLARMQENAPDESELREAQNEANDAHADSEHARGEIEQFSAVMPHVAGAEDELAAAQRECDRVEQLEQTLSTTAGFLEQAEERVHRDIAPVLRSTLREWLPRVTSGRYTEAHVDPETLTVEVSGPGGRRRRGDLLSHGTAEQVYLLLRIAMARHLSVEGEICPLILDDVVGACDTERKKQVLDTLRALSESTQVILFSQEQQVLDWARQHLQEPRDRVILLDASQVSV